MAPKSSHDSEILYFENDSRDLDQGDF